MKSPDERMVALLQEARRQLEVERSRREEPIAIVGIGCRLPGGVSNPDEFWDLLCRGVDTSRDVPPDRWNAQALYDPDPDAKGKTYTKRGSFLDSIAGFEPEFFGISPREALGMDPQQRLLLEVAWEALEDAGIVPERLRGTATGVWVGLCVEDYARKSLWSSDLANIDAYSALGNARSIAAGRISYVFDLRGPTVQLDTACSSSLVAVHQACQSLRTRECNLALAGGVSLMSTPESTIALCRLRALAPDGRCKTFDASADGYGRGEGCGIVLLKRLSDAREAGDRIHAVLRGSAINHDGHSNGLTAPNGLAQEAVLRQALNNAGLEPADVALIEAHGTGTLLGDPIEVLALSRVYGARAPDSPLYLGAVKTNLGHLEAAAGVAGLIKLAMCLSREQLVPTLHLQQPNRKIPWADLPVQVVTQARAWRRNNAPRRAGVSSFGLSGTNAHVLVEEAPALEPAIPPAPRNAELFVLSARTRGALSVLAGRLLSHLESRPDLALRDIAYSLATTRALLAQRLSLSAGTRDELRAVLRRAERDETAAAIVGRDAREPSGKLAWLFTGQGSQQLGMGQGLYAEWPAFREALDRAFAALDPWLDRPLRSVMWASPGSTEAKLLDQTGYAQPALFAIEWALAQLWQSWGVVPDLLLGHSIGEISAACVAGVFSLPDAARLVCARARLMQNLPLNGAMISIAAGLAEVAPLLTAQHETVAVAALNAPTATVISGLEAEVLAVAESLAARGIQSKRLSVSHAFHSPLMEPMLEAFLAVAEGIQYGAPRWPLVSNVSGELAGEEIVSAQYWMRHVREVVRFSAGVKALRAAGAGTFIELGPKATLIGLLPASLDEGEVVLLPTLRASRSEAQSVLDALGGWVVQGGAVDWGGVFPGGGQRVPLPTYPWQRQRYWMEAASIAARASATATTHPLLGARAALAGADAVYETVLDVQNPAWLSDHRVGGVVVVPAAALAELIRAAAVDHADGTSRQLEEMSLQLPLVLSEHVPRRVQVVITGQATKASVYSQPDRADVAAPWTLHSTARLSDAHQGRPEPLDLEELRRRCTSYIDVEQTYAALATMGLEYGPAFRGLKMVRGSGLEAIAEIALGEAADAERYGLHPALLDAALHAIGGLLGSRKSALLPYSIERVMVYQAQVSRAFVHLRLARVPTEAAVVVDLVLAAASGEVIAEVRALELRRADLGALGRLDPDALSRALYRIAWQPGTARSSSAVSGRWLIVAPSEHQRASAAAEGLRALGASCEVVASAESMSVARADHILCFWNREQPEATISVAQRGLALARTLIAKQVVARLWWVTEGAVATSPAEGAEPSSAALWGLVRTLMREHPGLPCKLVDVDARTNLAEVLASEVATGDDENQVAWREGRRYVARLVRVAPLLDGAAPRPLRTDGTVLISGGLGALGLEVARSFAKRGVRHLLLLGRRGLATPGAPGIQAELEALGARVTIAAVDIADRGSLAQALQAIPIAEPLRGVVHLAAALDDGLLAEQTPERFANVMRPKVTGAWHLHELTQQWDLDLFVLFSSVAGSLGSVGQSSYAAANASLDALASRRRAGGLTASSVAWGPWSERGLAAQLEGSLKARFARQGIGMISPSQGLALLDLALQRPEAELLLTFLDLPTVARGFNGAIPPLWRSLLRPAATRETDVDRNWPRDVAALPAGERLAAVTNLVRAEIAGILSLESAAQVPLQQPLQELGVDSLMEVELRSILGRRSRTELSATMALDHPTVLAIARYLLKDVLQLAEPGEAPDLESMDGLVSSLGAEQLPVDRSADAATLRADARLDAGIKGLGGVPATEAAAVLLTGATGFLGAFLLTELCQQTRAQITCLVRAESVAAGHQRVVENLHRYGLSDSVLAGRVRIVLGDLEKAELGLGEAEFLRLAEELDAIYSNGVRVSFVAAYHRLKSSHVNGTREILRLASLGRPKCIHHVSSTSAYSSSTYRGHILGASQPPLACEDMVLPYAQCKWVTEAMAREASTRGVPVVIYRPAVIGGASVSGAWSTDDLILRTLIGVADLGCLPGPFDSLLDFSPVDYVARALVYLSRQPVSRQRAFNLNHPMGLRWNALAEIIGSLGYPVTIVPYEAWLERIEVARHPALYPLLPFLRARGADGSSYLERQAHAARLTCEETTTALADSGIRCPPLDAALIGRYLAALRKLRAAGAAL